MCGRYVQATPFPELAAWLGGGFDPQLEELYRPRWNISPTSTVLGMRLEDGDRQIGNYRWGLVAPWSKEVPKFATHNARVESVATKPTFKNAYTKGQRAVVPAQAISSGSYSQMMGQNQ